MCPADKIEEHLSRKCAVGTHKRERFADRRIQQLKKTVGRVLGNQRDQAVADMRIVGVDARLDESLAAPEVIVDHRGVDVRPSRYFARAQLTVSTPKHLKSNAEQALLDTFVTAVVRHGIRLPSQRLLDSV